MLQESSRQKLSIASSDSEVAGYQQHMNTRPGQFAIDTSITAVSRMLQLAIGVGTSVLIARALGPAGRGIYALAILLPTVLTCFGNFGVGQAAVFHVNKNTYSAKEVLANTVSLSLLLGVAGFLAGLVILLAFGDLVFPGVRKTYLFLALFLLPLNLLLNFVNHLLLGLQRIKEYNFVSVLRSLVFLALLFILLFVLSFGVKAAITASILSYVVAATVLLYLAKGIIGFVRLRFNGTYVKDAFRFGSKVYLGNLAGLLHYRVDMFLVNIFLNPMAVGLYSIAVVLAEKVWIVSQSAGKVLFPKVCAETDEKSLKEFTPIVCRIVLWIALIGAIVLLFLGRVLIVLLYSDKFAASVLPFQILLIGIVAMSGWRILNNDLYGRGKARWNIYINGGSAALNVLLNILFIPRWGVVGAAWATSASYTFAFVMVVIVYASISHNNIWTLIVPQKSDLLLCRRVLTKIMSNRCCCRPARSYR